MEFVKLLLIELLSVLCDVLTAGLHLVVTVICKPIYCLMIWRRQKCPAPECLSDSSLGHHGYLTINGRRLHYVASGPEDKPLMLFSHGFPEFWFSWRHQIREFQKDYRCVAVDHRGYGESSKPVGAAYYTVRELMSDLRQLVQSLGYSSCILVSHDWGGALAFAFARFYPELVDKLIVMNAPAQPAVEKLNQNIWMMELFFQLPYLPELLMMSGNMKVFDSMYSRKTEAGSELTISKEELAAYKYMFSQPDAWTPPLNWYRALFSKVLPKVCYDMDYQMPVLLLWGEQDKNLSIDLLVQMEKECPRMEVRRFPEAGHFVQEDLPGEVNAAMREWLSSK